MVFTLSFNTAFSRVILHHWQWQSVGYGPVKMLRPASARPTWLDCQRSTVLLPHFRSVLTAKDLKFRFHTSALPWLPKTWCSASALPLCLDCQRSEVPLPLCLYCQRYEVPRPHFRSALTAKNVIFRYRTSLTAKYVKFCKRTSALPSLAKCFPHLFCQDFQKCEVPLPHFISAWTYKDLQFRFCTFAQCWVPKTCRSASPLTLCLHCQISSASALPFCLDCKDFCTSILPWLQKICSFTFQICLHSQRCERTSVLPWLPSSASSVPL